MLYQTYADLAPSLIYYHAGAAILAIHDELNDKKDVLFGKKYSSQQTWIPSEKDAPNRIILQIVG